MEPDLIRLVNRTVTNIQLGLKTKDVELIRRSWEELRQTNQLHILTPTVIEQIAQLITATIVPRREVARKAWSSARRSFAEEVALAAAATDSTDALNACLAAYIALRRSQHVLELYERYEGLPRRREAPKPREASEGLDVNLNEDGIDIVSSKTHSGRANVLLAVVTAHAMENTFEDALKVFLNTEIQIPTHTTEEFLRTLSYDPDLKNKVKLYVHRLDIAKSVDRPDSLSKHIHNLSKRSAPVLVHLYHSIVDALTEPAYIAVDVKSITPTKSVAMSELVWGSFLAAFLRREQDDLAANVWKDMAKFKCRPGILTWNMVINAYADRGAIDKVLEAWRTISTHNVKPDALTYRAIISCLFEGKRMADALQWFNTFETDAKPSCTVEHSLLVHNVVLHGLLRLGRDGAETASSIFLKMQKDGPQPDLISYNTMLGYHGRQADFKAMAAVINQMGSAQVAGDVFTFSTILSALLKVGQADAPAMVMNIMRNQGVQANVATYSAIIQSQMAEQTMMHLKASMSLLDEMEKDRSVEPNEITYTSILAGLYRGSWLSADQVDWYKRDIIARMHKMKVSLKAGGYNILIRACLKEPGGLEDALAFHREMARNKIPRGDDTCMASHRRLVGQPLLYAISIFASLGVFLFGYDQGVMSGIITGPHFKKYFNDPSASELGIMVAVLEIGAFCTSIAAGRVGDMIGRKGTLFIGAVVFTIGGAIQTFTVGFWTMVFGRIISGCGVGLLSTIVPIYQSEISPRTMCRGALACMEFTGNIIGYSASVWTDYFCAFIESNLSWRIPLFIQCVIGAILAGGSLLMPESPRGNASLADLHGGDPENEVAIAEFEEIKEKVQEERNSGEARSYTVMWRRYKRRVLLAMSSQAFAQLNGINVISYYAPRVFEEAGWHGRDAILMAGINSIIYVLSTLPPWYLVDRWGRRPILLSGAVIMATALVATGYWLYIDVPQTAQAVVVCVIIFNAAFGYRRVPPSWGPLPWLYPPEIMPLTIRAKGVSLSTATNWAFNFWVGLTTPVFQELIEWRLYPMHGFFCACSFVLVYFLYPETKGVPLEEMDAVFGEDERQDRMDDESLAERRSLVSHQGRGSWFRRLFKRESSGPAYQPVADNDE
ncbi:hypothetical protein K438DRAFT_1956578 [Mycena galopus ATCC 62051]|nr:hypothetical protein K438DRAFT_1956578 [Mycena galopus ATCC 62051]